MAETVVMWSLAILLGLAAAGAIVVLIFLGLAFWSMRRAARRRTR